MPKQLLKRLASKHDNLKNHKHLQIFGRLLHAPYLWHLNRRSVARAFAIGLFITMIPVPIHMLLATASSIIFRANLPLSVALVWVNNPITMPPIFYGCYLLGAMLLGQPLQTVTLPSTFNGFMDGLGHNLAPLLLGCIICGLALSIAGYFGISWLWRWYVIQQWKRRQAKRLAKNNITNSHVL